MKNDYSRSHVTMRRRQEEWVLSTSGQQEEWALTTSGVLGAGRSWCLLAVIFFPFL